VERWPMTNVLASLQEPELRVGCTDAVRTVGTRAVRAADGLPRRVLLGLQGRGPPTGLHRMGQGGGGDSDTEGLYVRRRSRPQEARRAGLAQGCHASVAVRPPALWGAGTTACASDSPRFGAWDQHRLTEWQGRYGGPGVMIAWPVEKNAVWL